MVIRDYLLISVISLLFFYSCSSIKQVVGMEKDNPNEFLIQTRDPLVLPPDFNILPPDTKSEKTRESKENFSIKSILDKDTKETNSFKNSTLNNSQGLEQEILKKIK